jgi:TolB protein
MKFLIRAGVLVLAVLAPFAARAAPNFAVEQVRMFGGDNLPSAGEPVTMKVVLHNAGSDAEGVEADLSLTGGDQYIQELTITYSAFGSIAAGESGDNANDPFAFITSSYQSEAPVRFQLQIKAAEGYQQTLPLPEMQTTLGIRGGFPEGGPIFLGTPHSFDGDIMVSYRVPQLGQQTRSFVSDLDSYQERPLSPQASEQIWPNISAQTVVWMDDRFRPRNEYDILVKDLSSDVEQRITTGQAVAQYPRIDGRRVVWQDRRGGGRAQVYLYDLDAAQERQLTFEPVDHNFPKISGNRIIWWDNRSGTDQVFVYDLSDDSVTQISEGPAGGSYAEIAGNRAIYLTGSSSFVLYDFDTLGRTQVSTPPLSGNVRIGADFVVFAARVDGTSHIFSYEIATGLTQQLTTFGLGQQDPIIAGDRVVWIDYRTGLSRYFLSNLIPAAP